MRWCLSKDTAALCWERFLSDCFISLQNFIAWKVTRRGELLAEVRVSIPAASVFPRNLLNLFHQVFWKLYASDKVKRSKSKYIQNLHMLVAGTVRIWTGDFKRQSLWFVNTPGILNICWHLLELLFGFPAKIQSFITRSGWSPLQFLNFIYIWNIYIKYIICIFNCSTCLTKLWLQSYIHTIFSCYAEIEAHFTASFITGLTLPIWHYRSFVVWVFLRKQVKHVIMFLTTWGSYFICTWGCCYCANILGNYKQ